MKACLFLLSFLIINAAFGKMIQLDSGLGRMTFESNPNWELKHNLFGMENWLFSPKLNNSRSNITITDTKAKIELDIQTIKKSQKKYEHLKRKWARKVDANIISFKTLKSFKNTQGHFVHTTGISYLFKKKNYEETSYYIECRGNVLFVKSLRLEQNEEHQQNINQIVKTMDCSM